MNVEALALKDIISAILASTALVVSLVTFVLNYRHNRAQAALSRQPMLVFEYDDTGWVLRNVGYGPALNVIVAQKRVGGEWFNPVRVPPLSKDGRLHLVWLGHVNDTGLGALYQDAADDVFTSTCGNDLSKVSRGALFGPWPEQDIGRHWYQEPNTRSR
jgi:hypothetical protein